MSKTHYRKVFKSDHLSSADLEDYQEKGDKLQFTISHVNQEMGAKVAGKTGNFNIAYFKEDIKPLVLNATNSKTLKALTGSAFVEDWNGILVQLYIDTNVQMMGSTVSGVRISPNSPQTKPLITPESTKLWSNAITAYKRDGNFSAVLERAEISEENMKAIMDFVKENESV